MTTQTNEAGVSWNLPLVEHESMDLTKFPLWVFGKISPDTRKAYIASLTDADEAQQWSEIDTDILFREMQKRCVSGDAK